MKWIITRLFVMGTLGAAATFACTTETITTSPPAPAAPEGETPAADDTTAPPDTTPTAAVDAGKDGAKPTPDSGSADTGTTPCTTKRWYKDGDGDGYGSSATSEDACVQPSGFVAAAGDCDDTKSAVHPGALELCNATDDNCDGTVNGTAAESAACTAKVGSYAGTFTMYTAEKLGTTIVNQMTCTGTSAPIVDLTSASVLRGTVTCTYPGSLGGFASNQSGTLDGTVAPDGTADMKLTYTFGSGMTRTFSFKGTVANGRVDVVNGKGSWYPNAMSAVPWEVTVNIGAPKI